MKRINLALQGGGAHGAFTWGVLDRLLEDERIEIEAISGASAGAINGVVVAEGLAEGGRVKARQQLSNFWESVSNALASSPLNSNLWTQFLPPWLRDMSPKFDASSMASSMAFDFFASMPSAFQLSPSGYNPLRDIIEREVNFERVRACTTMQLFVAATRVDTGRLHVFTGQNVTLDACLASACLPTLYKAVEIDGIAYWDGGYTANPPLTPFIKHCGSDDVMVVQINPARRADVPTSGGDILHRLNEITFNASLLREIDAISFVNDLIDAGSLKDQGFRRMHLHRLGGGVTFENLANSSKFNGDWTFLKSLRDAGRLETDAWLKAHFDHIGRKSTMELVEST
ncbi:MAG: patatin-like phospholipase family protein [Hyphomicrobiaceae bacterium]|nr:patatin-like phospholipase family protein [Hyphomicrobiaceae bacterium]